jgi:hypothetical protein
VVEEMAMLRGPVSALALLSCLAVSPGTAGATSVFTIDNDADFIATYQPDFTKDFGANVRWGNAATNGDWEYSVVDGGDFPLPGTNPKQFAWATPSPTTLNEHLVSLVFDPDLSVMSDELTLGLDFTSGSITDPADSVGTPTVTLPVNALFVRARAEVGDVATLDDIIVTFEVDNTSINLNDVALAGGTFFDDTGNGSAEYIVLIDSRLDDGFTVTASADLQDGKGSVPQYGFKVGHYVPEPATVLFLGSGLVGLAVCGRARRARG